jgi:hypothetical protein
VLHKLSAFAGLKRSCTAQLELQRERRLARSAVAACSGGGGAGVAPRPPPPRAACGAPPPPGRVAGHDRADAPVDDAALAFLEELLPSEASFGGANNGCARAPKTAHLVADPADASAAAPPYRRAALSAYATAVASEHAAPAAASPPRRDSGGGGSGCDGGGVGSARSGSVDSHAATFLPDTDDDPLDQALRALPALPTAEQMLHAARGGGGGGGGGGSNGTPYSGGAAGAAFFCDATAAAAASHSSDDARSDSHCYAAAKAAAAAALRVPYDATAAASGGGGVGDDDSGSLSDLMAAWRKEELCAPLAAVATPWVDIRIKLPHVAPVDMPPQLRDALRALLDPTAVGVHAAVCPGCTLITLDGVLLAGGGASQEALRGGAEAAARALLRGPAQRFFAAQRSFAVSLSACDAVAVTRGGAQIAPAPAPEAHSALPPALPLLPAALHSGVETCLTVLLPPGSATRCRVRCRVHGQFLAASLTPLPGGDAWQHSLTLPPCGAAGVALVELEYASEDKQDSHTDSSVQQEADDADDDVAAALHSGVALRAVLLTPDAAIAAEVASLPAPRSAAEAAAASKLIVCLGHALRRGVSAPPPLVLAAARACLARRWHATAAALLPSCPPMAPSGGGGGGAPTLLHAALCAPAPLEALTLLLEKLNPAAAAATWAHAWGYARAGVTPMHLAAAASPPSLSLALLQALLRAFPGAAGAAWVACADASGRTPSAVARGKHPHDAALASLDALLRAAAADAAERMASAAASARDALRSRPHRALLAALLPPYRRRCQRRALSTAHAALSSRNDPLGAALATQALAAPALSPAVAWPRMPGAFPDADMEAAWLVHVAGIMTFVDFMAYPCAAAGHAAQLLSVWLRAGGLPSPLHAAYIVFVLLAVPTFMRVTPAWFTRHREHVHAFMRLLGSAALPLWMPPRPPRGQPLQLAFGAMPAGAVVSLVQQFCTLFGMTFFSMAAVVRTPLHAALQAASFVITVGVHGIHSRLPLRIAVSLLNLAVVSALERASRRAFREAWGRGRAGDAPKKKHAA